MKVIGVGTEDVTRARSDGSRIAGSSGNLEFPWSSCAPISKRIGKMTNGTIELLLNHQAALNDFSIA